MLLEKHMKLLRLYGGLLIQRAHKHTATRLSEKKLSRCFVDHRRVKVAAGSGGDGASSFHSEPRKEWGGPDGGNGGAGGDIIIKVDQQEKSLSSVSTVYRGKDGEAGSSQNRFGRNASPTYIAVPVGTLVKEEGSTLADLAQHGQLYTVAYGGAGGKGNRFFLSNENRAPLCATPGEKGQERVVQLELRTMAHAALVSAKPVSKIILSPSSPSRPACTCPFCGRYYEECW
ncbi:mitochondrial ribosome-associated GTPase 2 [Sinocyclocheilus grahami]|uniref:Mitochondrial ribosome associated GTPase 2 n=1 Tax=Sinocyclocheilus grahami TaxID=75366 RepID=A0A672L6G7_SINGR|nr:PREDICTED: mitochondrial ribosome-associated GTPase 2 [Sinocyclocheilus grahami]